MAEADFAVGTIDLEAPVGEVLAIEDSYSLAVLLAADDWRELADRALVADVPLANWVAAQGPSPKRWDAYLVCLVQADVATVADACQVEALEADTRRVRKYVRDGVVPEFGPVRRALSPFLPLSSLEGPDAVDPLAALEEKLRAQGVTAELAQASVEQFRATSEIRVLG